SIGILETSLTSRPRTTNVLSEHIEAKTETRHTFVNGSQIVVFFGYTIAMKLVYIVRNRFLPAYILAGFYLIM
ncbi:hypothetical protein BCN13_22945, partial [Salmonella enterica]|nr:hypothetical protein [Salmonella enterica]EAO7618264.1 hypothetical protein [Salmonella enterica]EAQ6818906.1 hypothetical protein [Salmonella enterica]